MRKIFSAFVATCISFSVAFAQNDCMSFFPDKEGAGLINKSYDAQNKLIGTMTYRVNSVNENNIKPNMDIGFTMADATGKVIDNGTIDAYCDNGIFHMKMINRTMSPEVIERLKTDTELTGTFLDYPNIFNIDPITMSPFKMDAASFTIKEKGNKSNTIRVSVRNRNYEKNEKIETPAGKFNAAKISFTFEVWQDGAKIEYRGVEWYTTRVGIVKSETHDKEGNLINYTVLTEIVNYDLDLF